MASNSESRSEAARGSAPGDGPGRRPGTRRDLLTGGAILAGSAAWSACASQAARIGAQSSEAPARTAADDARADELLADLTDQRSSVAPISEAERRARRVRLGQILSASGQADALLMESGATMTYLSGVTWGHSERFFGLVVTASGDHFWISPAFEASRAEQRIDGESRPGGAIVAWQEDEYFQKPLAAELARRDVQRLAIDPALRQIFVERLTSEIGRERIVSGEACVIALRGVKDAHEIELLRRANELTQRAIRTVAGVVRPGMNGSEIAGLLDRAHGRLGLQSPWCLALIGPAAALPHGEQADIRLKRGDVLLIDTGGSFHGYQSDNTRTWVFDAQPSNEVERVWNTVRDAQQRAFDAIRPGVPCGDIDRVARGVIDAAGFGPGYRTFTHRLGHGIGLEGHEDPYFDGGSTVLLAAGMTLSDEPGIYLPARFGVRLEDIVLVTDRGADSFGTWQKSPTSPD